MHLAQCGIHQWAMKTKTSPLTQLVEETPTLQKIRLLNIYIYILGHYKH